MGTMAVTSDLRAKLKRLVLPVLEPAPFHELSTTILFKLWSQNIAHQLNSRMLIV